MATNINSKTSNGQRLSSGEQPSYQYEPWDSTKGNLSVDRNPDNDAYDQAYSSDHDNGQNYNNNRTPEQQDSLDSLRNAENNAISGREPSYQERDQDNQDQSLYTGNGRNNTQNNKTKAKSKKRGLGAIITIAIILTGGATFLGSSNSLLIGAIENLFMQATDTQYTSTTLRYIQIVRGMLKGTGYNMPNKFAQRLADKGITVESGGLSFKGQFIAADDLENAYKTNVEFREQFNTARYGRAIGVYDKSANKTYKKFSISRNIFSKFRQTNDADLDTETFNKTMSDVFENNTSTRISSEHPEQKERPVYDDDGNPMIDKDTGRPITEVYEEPAISNSNNATTSGTDKAAAQTKATEFVNSISATAQKVGSLINAGCAIYRVGNLVAMTIAANSIIQSIHTFMTALEPPSKTISGYGDTSGINELLNKLSSRVTTTVTNSDTGAEEEVTGSPLESTGMQLILGGIQGTVGVGTISYMANHYSSKRAFTSLLGRPEMLNACGVSTAATSFIALAVNLSGGLATIFGGLVLKPLVFNVIGNLVISAALSFMIPTLASIFLNNYDTVIGIPWGNQISQGATNAQSYVAAQGGASPTTKEKIVKFNKTTDEIISLDAEIDRKNLSPFDASNQNTFFGSIAYKLLPIITSASTTSIASFLRVAGRSISSIMGGVSAEGEGTSFITTFGKCSDESANSEFANVGNDMYCGTIRTNDLSTNNLQPTDSEYKSPIDNNLESDGKIRKDSNLGRYITYCNNRVSPIDTADAGILADLSPTNGIIGTALGYIPIINNVMDIANAAIDAVNMRWATGGTCINTDSPSDENYDFWQTEAKYYQLYSEDYRILDQMGSEEPNPVAMYEEEYEKTHPTDYSLAGTIARHTGMAKTDAEYMIAFIEYYDFLNHYDPTVRIAHKEEAHKYMTNQELATEIKSECYYFEDDNYVDNPLETNAAHREYIAYFDIRNRSFAA